MTSAETAEENFDPETIRQMTRYAVRNDTIDVFFQPILNVATSKIASFEALADSIASLGSMDFVLGDTDR